MTRERFKTGGYRLLSGSSTCQAASYSSTVRQTGHTKRSTFRTAVGLSLLEVVLALAILGIALVMLQQLLDMGMRSATAARDLTTAQLLCESKLAELAAGIAIIEPQKEVPFEHDSSWVYSLDVQTVDDSELVMLQLTVAPHDHNERRRASYTLSRWLISPQAVWENSTEL